MYNLLIVDDEPKIRSGLACYYPWEQMGYAIAGEAGDGQEALNIIMKKSIDVVLTDIRMDTLSGLELCARLHKQKSKIIMVILSGYSEFDYAQQAIKYGVKNYLLKPTNYEEVIATFREIKQILDERTASSTDVPTVPVGKYSQIIIDVQTFIKNHCEVASLDCVADRVGLSSFYLSRLFKQETGCNFSEYLLKEKMEKATTLLSDYRMKIYEISSALGYDCPKSFTRAFTKYYGKTPQQFRNQRG